MYTTGLIQGLLRRDIPARLITCNPTANESAAKTGLPHLAVQGQKPLTDLDDTLIFMYRPPQVQTKRPAYFVLATPAADPSSIFTPGVDMPRTIVMSEYKARYWQAALGLASRPAVVYPFVDEIFSVTKRPRHSGPPRILFAGRAVREKGMYTLFESLHLPPLRQEEYRLTCVKGRVGRGDGAVINALYDAHPWITAVPPCKDRETMAKLYAEHDVVVMPTSSIRWVESFGMISTEAQHSGCRVVASNDGGLPETECGGLFTVEHDNPLALSEGIVQAMRLGPLTEKERQQAAQHYTVDQSVDALLAALAY
ncbi:MAG TPA: glycosyltransferase family 4 protein [Candidatus Saccharimonadales bacterium]|nr:glycosyltransferase family 4 protein [Candidatus Saccharimonadales bacterium]